MQELDDLGLLCEYVERGSEEAFATLVERHINKVYSVALRHTGNPHQAEEITQAVFVILARKSRQLSRDVILYSWLFKTARLTSAAFIRGEIRRTRREQEACMQNALNETKEPEVWPQVAPLLDSALAALNETDRRALVLRFFYGKSMKEIGTDLGANEDAIKQRVGRALEKLQHYFLKTDVLLLTTKRSGASGLKPTALAQRNDTSSAQVGHFHYSHCPISTLVFDLEYWLHVPVIDRTGLNGDYDFDLKWNDETLWDATEHRSLSNPDGLKQVLLDQLGLELVPGREPMEMLVVEKVK